MLDARTRIDATTLLSRNYDPPSSRRGIGIPRIDLECDHVLHVQRGARAWAGEGNVILSPIEIQEENDRGEYAVFSRSGASSSR